MREIKFRFWDEDLKKMCFRNPLTYDFCTDGVIPLQFTGLSDKKGQEIYEGDIVKNHKTDGSLKVGKVFYNSKRVGFEIDVANDDFYSFYSAVGNQCVQIEVIGNVYENKDLLK